MSHLKKAVYSLLQTELRSKRLEEPKYDPKSVCFRICHA